MALKVAKHWNWGLEPSQNKFTSRVLWNLMEDNNNWNLKAVVDVEHSLINWYIFGQIGKGNQWK